ncbi:hypothetical protein [Salisediminibacterium beveridgei]|uniref:Uncharacterized protein n=1 Tax=Salisediminibacterium beveridgei TaxID=632773 RepID=A0A1D7QZ67_9BACI|nr:hypothetical protein [Salisediminibacterium beveridgei]AOM84306.1 hypothetical protein BBEV_2986 [Salisediminibacterium beveridgei]
MFEDAGQYVDITVYNKKMNRSASLSVHKEDCQELMKFWENAAGPLLLEEDISWAQIKNENGNLT